MSIRRYIADTARWRKDRMGGVYEYTEEVFLYNGESDEQPAFVLSVELECTAPYVPAQIHGPPENCYPAEGPEFEPREFAIIFNGKKRKIDAEQVETMLGQKYTEQFLERAEQAAYESGEF